MVTFWSSETTAPWPRLHSMYRVSWTKPKKHRRMTWDGGCGGSEVVVVVVGSAWDGERVRVKMMMRLKKKIKKYFKNC
jgi:hypothetical protein